MEGAATAAIAGIAAAVVYRKSFDTFAEETAGRALAAGSEQLLRALQEVQDGNGKVDEIGFLRLCAALGRPLYAHEVGPALAVLLPAPKQSPGSLTVVATVEVPRGGSPRSEFTVQDISGIDFDAFQMWFSNLLRLDKSLLALFTAQDTDKVEFLRPAQVHALIDRLGSNSDSGGTAAYNAFRQVYPPPSYTPGNEPRRRLKEAPRSTDSTVAEEGVRWEDTWHQYREELVKVLQTPLRQRSEEGLAVLEQLFEDSRLFSVRRYSSLARIHVTMWTGTRAAVICACVRACVRRTVRACVRAILRACVRLHVRY